MNDLATLDLVLRAATVAVAAAAALALARLPGRNRAARQAALVVGGMGAFMIASAPGAHATLGLAAFFFNAWCLATPVFVTMLAASLFNENGVRHHYSSESKMVSDTIFVGVYVALTMAGDYGRFRLGPMAEHPGAAQALLLAGRAVALALLFTACGMAIRHWREDLVEQRRRARAAFVAIFGAMFVALASSEFVFGGRGAPLGLLVVGHTLVLALLFALLQLVIRGAVAELFVETDAKRTSSTPLALVRSDPAEAALAKRVGEAMNAGKLWKRDGLGIGDLASELGTQEYLLRRAINRHLGYRNFNEFLHDYRLTEAAARLADRAQDRLPVLTIALDCGYGSIGPFNRAFKARFGMTPTEYRGQERRSVGA